MTFGNFRILAITLVILIQVSASELKAQTSAVEKPEVKTATVQDATYEGVSKVKILNYEDCIQLKNETTRVVLGHHSGGRLLVYENNGKNVLFLDPKESEWDPDDPKKSKQHSAGRFDVGPEYIKPRSDSTWVGMWSAEATGDHQARMTSKLDPKTKIQVTRDFKLAKDSTRLTVTQTVENKSDKPVRQCYWSRTFAIHGGVAVVPCDPSQSVLPNLYYFSQNRYLLNFKPEDPAIRRVKNFIVVDGPAAYSKTGFDAAAGWAAYQTRTNQLFVKRFPTSASSKYGDPGAANFALWYPKKDKLPACEIEPIGPMVTLKPGDRASFSVNWWLLDREFPKSGVVNPDAVAESVKKNCVLK